MDCLESCRRSDFLSCHSCLDEGNERGLIHLLEFSYAKTSASRGKDCYI